MNIRTSVFDSRNKRNLNHLSVPAMNYSTYSLPDITENKNMKSDFYNMYHPDFKSLSDMADDKKFDGKSEKSEPWLRSALHVCTMIFRKISGRASSPELSYHDCESPPGQQSAPRVWQKAKTENKNFEAHAAFTDCLSDMNDDYDGVVASCEDKLNKVRQLIASKPPLSSPKCTTYKSRRRRRVFVESSSVEDSFEDAFSPEDFISNSNSDTLKFLIPFQYQKCEFMGIDAHKMKIETPRAMRTETSKDLKDSNEQESQKDLHLQEENIKTEVAEPKPEETKTNIETVSSCESKIMQLQAMLKERRKKNTKTLLNSSDSALESVIDRIEPTKPKVIPTSKSQDKRYKNPHRTSGKRKKSEIKKLIHDDMLFADEIAETPSTFENSPIVNCNLDKSIESLGSTTDDCFDEVAGRFRTASGTDSEDSFQVVFSDSPRAKRPSDCESEDSFIVFEDSPDSCYTSNDVFGDESDSESEYSDTDSEISDSGCVDSDEVKIPHNMSKTFEDLTDDRLYDGKDEVDNTVNICVEIPLDELNLDCVSDVKSTGLLLNDTKKHMRKNQPVKKVHFSTNPPKVHVLRVWAFAARQARAGHWERHALDRERFKRRIADADMALSWVLKPQHRSRVMFQRFMPWWNAQKRQELAEKKQRQEDEKRRLEEETRRLEEEKVKEEQMKNEANVQDENVENKMNEQSIVAQTNGEEHVALGDVENKNNLNEQRNVKEKQIIEDEQVIIEEKQVIIE